MTDSRSPTLSPEPEEVNIQNPVDAVLLCQQPRTEFVEAQDALIDYLKAEKSRHLAEVGLISNGYVPWFFHKVVLLLVFGFVFTFAFPQASVDFSVLSFDADLFVSLQDHLLEIIGIWFVVVVVFNCPLPEVSLHHAKAHQMIGPKRFDSSH
jgi:hypothetical protein